VEAGRLTAVSKTAVGVAAQRATESTRPDRLFHDPYAAAFVASAGDVLPLDHPVRTGRGSEVAALLGVHVVVRTRFYDEYLRAAVAAGCGQVVLLAAGLDTRAFRLDWPAGVRLFELDLPELLDFKEGVLDARGAVPRCARTLVGVDLREDWPARLTAAGLDPAAPVAWLIEGLLVYLDAAEAAGVLTAVGGLSVPGSRLACEQRPDGTESLLESAKRDWPGLGSRLVGMWKGGLGQVLPDWLAMAGWRVRVEDGRAIADGYGRPVPGTAGFGFLTAVRVGAPGSTS
jgi:methyltransferase (TIGR00027 family)